MDDLRHYIRSLVSVSDATLDAVEGVMHTRQLTKNEYLARAGEFSNQIAFLRAGIMRAYYRTDEAQEYNKTLFVGPCMVGALTSLVTGQENKIYIQALVPCEVLVGDYQELLRLYDAHPDLERFARRMVEVIYVQKEEREIDLVLLTARDRYLKFLEEYGSLTQEIPLYHIASYLGVTPTQLSRIRNSLAQG